MRIAAAAARRNEREAQRAEREKAIAKAAEKAKINEMLALLRPLRSFAVKDNGELDTLNLLRPPQMLGVATEYISDDGTENTGIFLTAHSHWKYTNSTTCTFASKSKTIRSDMKIWKQFFL